MTIVRFPREYREPPPPEREQLELWPELPAPPPKRDAAIATLTEIAEAFDAISEHLDAIRIGLVLLDEGEQ